MIVSTKITSLPTEKESEVFRSLKQKWEIWNDSMLLVTNEIRTRTIKGKEQTDRYGL